MPLEIPNFQHLYVYDVSETSFNKSEGILKEFNYEPIEIKEFVTSFDDLYFMPIYGELEKLKAS